MSDLLLVFPEASEDLVSNMMVAITKKIDESGSEIATQGILGGEYGYGAHYKNDVFEMRPFYWGECTCDYDKIVSEWEDTHEHKYCYQTMLRERHYEVYETWNVKEKPGHGWTIDGRSCDCVEVICAKFDIDPKAPGGLVHCTCGFDDELIRVHDSIDHSDDCQMDKPNFKHYASGIEVEWYKYIGRGMEYDEDVPIETWVDVFKDCISSIGPKLGGK